MTRSDYVADLILSHILDTKSVGPETACRRHLVRERGGLVFGIGIVEVAVLLLLLIGVATLVVRATSPARRRRPRDVSSEWRHVVAVRLLAFVVGVAAAAATYGISCPGRGPMLALSAFGGCVLLGTALGETLVRPRRDWETGRSASLTPRRVRDYLPPMATPVAGMVGATLILLTLTTVTADGGPGLERGLGCATATFGSMHTPYPGSYYSLPLALALLAVLVVAAIAARQVVARPRGMAADPADDDLLRRGSLEVIVAAAGCAVGAPLFGICLVAGGAMRSLSTGEAQLRPGVVRPGRRSEDAGSQPRPLAADPDLPGPAGPPLAQRPTGQGAQRVNLTVDTEDPTPPYERLRRRRR